MGGFGEAPGTEFRTSSFARGAMVLRVVFGVGIRCIGGDTAALESGI